MRTIPNDSKFSIFLLPTALVKVYIDNELIGIFRALCDSGSQPNLICHDVVKHYFSKMKAANGNVMGISDSPVYVRKKLTVGFSAWFENNIAEQIKTNLWVLPKKSKWAPILPNHDIPSSAMSRNLHPRLADPMFWQADKISILLGIEMVAAITEGSSHKVGKRLVSQESQLGLLLYGKIGECDDDDIEATTSKHVCNVSLNEIDKNIQNLWYFKDLELCNKNNSEHKLIEKIFTEKTYRDTDGKFVVSIPLKPTITELGSSRAVALRRFFSLEKKMQRDDSYRERYIEFMREYEELGHMIEATNINTTDEQVYYIPHHAVVTLNKFRVVFDGSCPTDKGLSLNDAQLIGPKLQPDLCETLMRFRRQKIAVSGDIAQMYRQVKIIPEQWNLQRIFWRESPKHRLKEYCLVVVTYGLASSPFLSVRAIQAGADMMYQDYPDAATAIKGAPQ